MENHEAQRAASIEEISAALAGLSALPRLDDLVHCAVDDALARWAGNRTYAARSLGISVRTLQRTLKRRGGGSLEG